MDKIYEKARELAALVTESEKYREYLEAKQRAEADAASRVLLDEYRRMQYTVQAETASGRRDEEHLLKLRRLSELLQLNPVNSDYLLKQYALDALLGDIYAILANAVGISLDGLSE